MSAALSAGCLSGPPVDNPVLVRNAEPVENPIMVSPGQPTPQSYQEVVERVRNVLADYFDILSVNPYDGRILTKPRIAPGYEQWWKPGNPDPRQRLLATFQSVRQVAMAEIKCGERGGFLVLIIVDKELEDLPRPTRATLGGAVFQDMPTVAREWEVVTPDLSPDRAWFKIGRDYAFEQEILRRIRHCK